MSKAYTAPVPPKAPVVSKETEKKIHMVFFRDEAVLNFNYVKNASGETYNITLVEDIVFLQDRGSKVQYLVPMSNIRTIVFL